MGAAFDKIKRLITKHLNELSAEEREQLIARLKASLAIQGGVKVDKNNIPAIADDCLTYAIRYVLVKRKVLPPKSATQLIYRVMERLTDYARNNELMRQWIEEQFLPKTEAERQHFAIECVEMLYNYLNKFEFWRDKGVGPYELMINLTRIPSAVEGELPGYAASGLLRIILTPKHPQKSASTRKRLRSSTRV